MASMTAREEVDVIISYRQIGLFDDELHENLPLPHQIGHPWLSTGTATLLLELDGDGSALFYFELWNGEPPPLTESDWPLSELVELNLPSGQLCVEQVALGALRNVFDVGGPGRYFVRLAWRRNDRWTPESEDPEAFLIAQFWSASAS